MPYRRVAVCRELTKIHEEIVRGTIDEVLRVFVDEREARRHKRRNCISNTKTPNDARLIADKTSALLSAEERVSDLLNSGQYSKKDIVRILKDEFGLTRNDAYELVHHKGQIP